MALPDVVEFARNFAVMVRVQGPDPKGMKMRKHAFHQYHSGKTTLSASGMLLPDTLYDGEVAKGLYGQDNQCPVLVVTVASVVEPFLSLQHRQNIAKGPPELISGVEIDVMVEGKMGSEDLDEGAPRWIGAKILTLADIPASALALQSITEASSGSPENGWEVGWSLASHGNGPQPIMDAIQKERDAKSFLERQSHLTVGESGNFSLLGKSTTRIAILGVSLLPKDVPNIVISPLNKRGDFLLALGSPFGVLSPLHFFNRAFLWQIGAVCAAVLQNLGTIFSFTALSFILCGCICYKLLGSNGSCQVQWRVWCPVGGIGWGNFLQTYGIWFLAV